MSNDSDKPYPDFEGGSFDRASSDKSSELDNNSPSISDSILQHIGKYEVRGMLGRGSAGIVYLGYDPQLQRQVAIKVLRIARSGALGEGSNFEPNPQVAKRFLSEAQSTGKLRHANIIALYEGNVFGPSPFLVMEFVEGKTLDAYVKARELFSLKQLIPILEQLADAIDYAHSQGVLHRDIKPANILIGGNLKPYILDFGVAKIHEQISAEDEGVRATSVLGTPAYMSPEQIRNKPLNNQSDLFAFAIVAFQCLSGIRPFDGDTFAAVASSILEKNPRSISSLRADLSTEVDEVFTKALAKERSKRFESAKLFIKALAVSINAPHIATKSMLGPTDAVLVSQVVNNDIETVRSLVTKAAAQKAGFTGAAPPLPKKALPQKDRIRSPSVSLMVKEASTLTIMIFFTGLVIGLTSILCYVFWPRRTVLVIAGQPYISGQGQQTPLMQSPSQAAVPSQDLAADPASEKERLELVELVSRLNDPSLSSESISTILNRLKEKSNLDFDVLSLLKHPSFLVRVSGIKMLIDRKKPEVVPQILPLLEDSDPLVRGFAAKALGILADRKHSEMLASRATKEKVPEVIRAIENAMERIAERG